MMGGVWKRGAGEEVRVRDLRVLFGGWRGWVWGGGGMYFANSSLLRRLSRFCAYRELKMGLLK